jgi:enamine deaminase RidA (YjgF/YER057c/UK114 family)
VVDLLKPSDYISTVTRQESLQSLGFSLDLAPSPAANYSGLVVNGGTAYVSGCLPLSEDGLHFVGKLGGEVTLEEGRQAAALCAANILRLFNRELGGLDRIERLVRLGGFVHCTPDFTDSHLVMNGASELMLHVLGTAGQHARAAVGVAQLPLGASVEIDAIVQIRA